MKVKIKCWNGVATWLWVANDENCGICRMAFNGCCPDCVRLCTRAPRAAVWRRCLTSLGPGPRLRMTCWSSRPPPAGKVPGDDCPLVWGQCSHCFHMHCILKWLNAQQVQQHCPMCRQEWKFKE
ncbi:anaphase-promoting complex subunit 11 isoform X1 [Canis aureus]|eukprot:XP_022278331.1 anaphase-promoting complex subunit 11 isoform X1 [Canis lupus familiaris]